VKIREEKVREQWLNDYLDLYLFAREIGDLDWQQDILSRLQKCDVLVKEQMDKMLIDHLWQKFDEINTKLLDIYEKMKNTPLDYEFEQLQDRAWELKQERVNVSLKLRCSLFDITT
jgi:hypothetical protein